MNDQHPQPRHRADVPIDYIRVAPTRRRAVPRHSAAVTDPPPPSAAAPAVWMLDEAHTFDLYAIPDDLQPHIERRNADIRMFTNATGPGDIDDPMVEL